MRSAAIGCLLLTFLACTGRQTKTARKADAENVTKKTPLVFAHRGASGYRPEHTKAAYLLAIAQGADYIEPDVVASKDGVLVVRHENEISGTTDVADRPEFAARRATKEIDGQTLSGWFTEDFTLAELRTLRARERLPQLRPASASYDGQYEIVTLAEVLDLAIKEGDRAGRPIGVCPETKHPSYFRKIGLALEPILIAELQAAGLDRGDAPICIQSFEISNLRALNDVTDVQLVQLVWKRGGPADQASSGLTYASMTTAAGLTEIATYADIVSPEKSLVIARNTSGAQLSKPTALIGDAHAAGLRVVPYTFRKENEFLPGNYQDDLEGEIRSFLDAGVDGLFSDFPDIAVAARDAAAGDAQ